MEPHLPNGGGRPPRADRQQQEVNHAHAQVPHSTGGLFCKQR